MKRQIQRNLFAVTMSGIILLTSAFALKDLLAYQSSPIQSSNQTTNTSLESSAVDTTSLEKEEHFTFDDVLTLQKQDKDKATKTAQDILKNDYNNNLKKAQPDILNSLKRQHLKAEDMAYLFLDHHPAKHTPFDSQMDVPLLLQTDPKWRNLAYGTDSSKQLWENGCAIVSLAMVKQYLDGTNDTPETILNWSQQTFYRHNEGTSWFIFPEFAKKFNYTYTDLGDDFYGAMEQVKQGNVVVVSVKSGYFTEVGHILVIRGYDDGLVFVNDPNDSPEKLHSYEGISETILLNEGLNYWVFSK